MRPWVKKFYIATMIMVLVLVLFVGLKCLTIKPILYHSIWLPHVNSQLIGIPTPDPHLIITEPKRYVEQWPNWLPIYQTNRNYITRRDYHGPSGYPIPSKITLFCRKVTLSSIGYRVGIVLHGLTCLCLCTLFLLEEHYYQPQKRVTKRG